MPRPDEATYGALISSLESSLDGVAAAHPNPGRTDTFRRLNRTEYQNAIRDLLALEVDVSSLLPSDESSHGFDNVTVGDLPPVLLERYLSAAQKIGRLALGRPVRSPGGDTINFPPDLTQEDHFDGLPFGTRGGAALHYTFPQDASYDMQIRLQRDRNEYIEGLHAEHEVELMLDGERVTLFTVKPPPSGQDHHLADKALNIRVPSRRAHTLLRSRFRRGLPYCSRPAGSPIRRTSTWTGILAYSRRSSRSRSMDRSMRKGQATRPAAGAFWSARRLRPLQRTPAPSRFSPRCCAVLIAAQ